jgi:hypothetical protein
MAINWNVAIWRGLAAEAQIAADKVGDVDVRLQTMMVSARYIAKAVRAERKERDEQRDKAG